MVNVMFKKADMIIFVCILAAALAAAGIFCLFSKQGKEVVITVGGETYGSYPLDEDRSINVSTRYGVNKIVISDSTVFVASADCPNQLCVRQSPISRCGQSIVCLPHRLVVAISAGRPDVDATAG